MEAKSIQCLEGNGLLGEKKHNSCDDCFLYPKLNSVKLDKIMVRRRYTENESENV